MAGKIAIGYLDRCKPGSVTASSALLSLPVINVIGDDIPKVWRSQIGVTSASLVFDFGAQYPVGGVGLIRTNLSATGDWRIRLSNSDPTGVAGEIYDSTLINADVDTIYKKAVKLFSEVTARYLRIDLVDASLPYLEAGRAWCGRVYHPTFNYQENAVLPFRSYSRRTTGDDGSEWNYRGNTQRGFSFALLHISDTERLTHLDPMILQDGVDEPLLVVRDDQSTNLSRDTFYGTVDSIQQVQLMYLNGSSVQMTVWDKI